MIKLFRTSDRIKLYVLKSKLEEENIRCLIKNEEPPAAGEVPPVVALPELWVIDDEQYKDAIELIRREEALHCAEAKQKWKCPQCGEILDGQFDLCWNCGHSK